VFVLGSCGAAPAKDPAVEQREARGAGANARPELTAVILALDGVRWQEVFHGVDPELGRQHGLAAPDLLGAEALMPNLHALLATDGAVVGSEPGVSDIRASGPEFVSLPSYAEMLSGHTAPGCRDNACTGVLVPTLPDELASLPDSALGDVAAVTSWAPIARVATRGQARVALSTGRSAGKHRVVFERDALARALLREGDEAAPYPGHGDFRPDRYTFRVALRFLETQHPRFLFIGLGEPDEYAHRNDYRAYLRALRHADLAIGEVSAALVELARQGARTALFITTDHGRARNFTDHGAAHPESARVWLVATGTEIHARGRLRSPAPRRLGDLAPTLRLLFGMPQVERAELGRPLTELLASGT
jgi:hypothetical protein